MISGSEGITNLNATQYRARKSALVGAEETLDKKRKKIESLIVHSYNSFTINILVREAAE